METRTTTKLMFSKRLLSPAALGVRERLAELAEKSLHRQIYADTLLGIYLNAEPEVLTCQSFLLFDFYRIILYENSSLPDGPKINSVARYLCDDYFVNPKILGDYGEEQFRFFHSLEALEILEFLWTERRPGDVVTLGLANAEIRMAQAYIHPEAEQPVMSAKDHAHLIACDSPLGLKDVITGSQLRPREKPELEDLVSQDVGIIRQEKIMMGQLSCPTVVTQLAVGDSKLFFCSGRAGNISSALISARCEAVERHLANFCDPGTPLTYGSYDMLREVAIDPSTLCFNYPRPDPAHRRISYNNQLSMYWCSAQDLRSGKSYLVPAQEVWFNTHSLPQEQICSWSSTNGCALGSSIEEAALFAIFEIVERDAFLVTWYLRRPCRKIRIESIRMEEFQLFWCRLVHTHRNYSIQLFDITTDIALPVVLCIAIKETGQGPKTVVTTACRLHCDEAALCAIKDLAGMPDTTSYDETRARKLLERPEDISDPEDHAAYYSLEENFFRLSFIDFNKPAELTAQDVDDGCWVPRQSHYNLRPIVEQIAENLDTLGMRVLLRNLSHGAFLKRKLFCLRALMPDAYPMWFGYHGLRFSMTDRLQGLASRFLGRFLATENQVNFDVHPFD